MRKEPETTVSEGVESYQAAMGLLGSGSVVCPCRVNGYGSC